jgi:hypothetical protein
MVTDFVLRKDWWACSLGAYNYHGEAKTCCEKNGLDPATIKHDVVMSSVESLIKAINAYCKKAKVEAEEYRFCVSPSIRHDKPGELLPEKWAYLISFAVEGGSEGYYVHVGAILKDESGAFGGAVKPPNYMDFGFCKTYSPDSAYAIAREAQRFLTAAAWN